ncbi:hypothetical protein MUP79_09940 [Candidatus Bathyarchaeota archaeon]|nr:hypothetical protein [Candidatus Bathyarchaeota archaeon]
MANPLTAADKKNIDLQLKNAEAVKKDILRAKSAGLDVSGPEADLNAAITQLQKIKQAYFTTGD